MYSVGIPVGILVDSKGPRIAVIMGAILLALGYFPLHQAYDSASGSVPLLCLYSFFTGVGGCSAFAASIKASGRSTFSSCVRMIFDPKNHYIGKG